MRKDALIKEVKRIMEAVETDRYTIENLYYFIEDIEEGKYDKKKGEDE